MDLSTERGNRRGPRRPLSPGPLPNQIRRLRWRKGLTIDELADEIKVKRQHLGEAERTGKGLHRKSWYRLADFFEISPAKLETPDPYPDFYQ